MSARITVIASLITALLLSSCSTSSQFANSPTWKDEFNHKGSPKANMWTRSVTSLGEQLSAYRDDDANAYVKDGYLHLKIIKTNDKNLPYTAGRVITNSQYHFKKGKLVVRAKAPNIKGVWPAIWLNGPKTKDGYFAELDLMEHVYAMGDSCYEACYHLWGEFQGKKGNHVSYGQKVDINVGEWHIYTLEVTDDRIIMKVDDEVVYEITPGMYGDEWPKDQEYSLRLALAYGGYGATKHGVDDSALPAEMLVDYVRFYELKEK